MRYTVLLISIILFAACGGDTESTGNSSSPADSVKNADSMTAEQRDSLQKVKEEEEMSEHLIEGAFEALNR